MLKARAGEMLDMLAYIRGGNMPVVLVANRANDWAGSWAVRQNALDDALHKFNNAVAVQVAPNSYGDVVDAWRVIASRVGYVPLPRGLKSLACKDLSAGTSAKSSPASSRGSVRSARSSATPRADETSKNRPAMQGCTVS